MYNSLCLLGINNKGGVMEIRVLRYFLSVANEGNITKASNALNLTQPTLSRQLKELEEELGQKLFIRGSHFITLTNEGLILKKRAEEILQMVEKTKQDLSSQKEMLSGELHIGGGESYAMEIIAQIMKHINQEHPNVRFNIFSGNAVDVKEKLDKGLLDFGVLIQPTDLSKYESLTLPLKDTWGLLMRKDCELAKKELITKDDLLGIPIICSKQASKNALVKNDFSDWFDGDFEKLNVVATYNLIYNASVLVKEALGYAICLDKLINLDEKSELCFKPFSP